MAHIGGHHAGSHSRSLLGAVARAPCNRRLEPCRSACRMERNEEHPMEDRNPRPRHGVSGHLGRRIFLPTAVPVRVPLEASHSGSGSEPRGVHRFVLLAINRRDGRVTGSGALAKSGRTRPHMPKRHVVVELGHHRWRTGLCLFRVARSFRLRLEGTSLGEDLGDKQMRQQFGEGAPKRCMATRLVIVWDHQGHRSSRRSTSEPQGDLAATREEIDTWATPLIVEHAGTQQ